jgi:hypothetical protein
MIETETDILFKDHQVFKDLRDHKAILVLKVFRDLRAFKGHKVFRVNQVLQMGLRGLKVFQVKSVK